jgi:succinyl-CoA synthetase alpha subunit
VAILVGTKTKAIVWGITGSQGTYHTGVMVDYGTKITAGVTPGRGGQEVRGVPVFDTAREALRKVKANAAIIFVPAPYAKDATLEAIDANLNPVVIITEGIPVKDEIQMMQVAKSKNTTIIGPNTPGIITPGQSKLGIMPDHVFKRGKIGLVSRSGTLTYEIAASLTNSGLGQTTCLGVGGDPVVGLSFVDVLEMFRKDPATKGIAMIGEIGGDAEEKAAEYIKKTKYPKKIAAYIAGRAAPPGKRMGHAGAIITGKAGTAETKIESLKRAGVKVALRPGEIAQLLKKR